MKGVLVTGAAGFIGAAVSQALLDRGYRVFGIDNLNDYYDIRLKLHRLDGLRRHEEFRFDAVDVEKPDDTRRYLERRDIDVVYHLAARAGVRYSVDYPYVCQTSNVIGTLNVLEAMRHHGPSKAVLASSSSLYAGQSSPFRFTKWIAEGRPIQIYGDGEQKRDFTYISDIVAGTLAASKPFGYEIINLGGGNELSSLRRMIGLLESLLEKKAKATLEFLPEVAGDMRETASSIEKAKRLLDWEPEVSLDIAQNLNGSGTSRCDY